MAHEREWSAALSPVTNATRRDAVVDAIRRALLSGELTPGQRVTEARLAAALEVSRPTVREAIHQLIHEGSLVQEPYKGVRVADPSAEDLHDVAEVRVALETLAALQLRRDPDGPGMDWLRDALREHLDAIEEGDPVRADVTHLAVHRALWEGGANQMLLRIWPLVESQIRVTMSLDQAASRDLTRHAELHVRLIEVIATGDEQEIAAEIRRQVAGSAD